MHEDYLLSGGEDKIGVARQVPSVEAVAVTHVVNKATDNHLRFGIGISDTGHALAPFISRQWVIAWHRKVPSPAQPLINLPVCPNNIMFAWVLGSASRDLLSIISERY
jgi:hypothetical protein